MVIYRVNPFDLGCPIANLNSLVFNGDKKPLYQPRELYKAQPFIDHAKKTPCFSKADESKDVND
jgi:hypothetical protein